MNRSRTRRAAVGLFYFYPDASALIFYRYLAGLLLMLLLCGSAAAQTNIRINGHVYDEFDGSPVVNARVSLVGTDYTVNTDRNGFYQFENIPDGRYRLSLEAEGYLSHSGEETAITSDITRRRDFYLQRRVYSMENSRVVGTPAPPPAGNLEVIDRMDIQESGADNLARVLENVEGVYVTETGPAGGTVRVSIRGCDPRHVLILMDGLRLNNASTGEADLSAVPLEMVEKVEVLRGGQSARYGPDAMGGVINIVTQVQSAQKTPEFASGKYWGRWKTSKYTLTVVDPPLPDHLTGRFTYGSSRSNADFDYDYQVSTKTGVDSTHSGTRANAVMENSNYHGSGLYQLNERTSLSVSGQVYRARQGLPGSVARPDNTAWKEDNRTLAGLRVKSDRSVRYHLELAVGFSRFEQYFNNMAGDRVSERYENLYVNDIISVKSAHLFRPWAGGELGGGLEFERNTLYQNDIYRPVWSKGRSVRDNTGLYLSGRQAFDLRQAPLLDAAVIDLSLRWDNTEAKKDLAMDLISVTSPARVDHYEFWSKAVYASVSRGDRARLVIRGGYGTSFSLPSVNAIFWKSDLRTSGSGDLRPERSEHSDVGLEVSAKYVINFSAGITYFHSFIKDLIIWRQATLGWVPDNLEAARLTGHEDFVRIGILGDRVQIGYQNTITVTKNRHPGLSHYNKELTYRPRYVTNIDGTAKWWKLKGQYRVRMVGQRFATAANTKWYDAYRVDDINLAFKTDIQGVWLEATWRVNNLRAEDYVLIGGYPMPGREWGVEISLTYKLKQ